MRSPVTVAIITLALVLAACSASDDVASEPATTTTVTTPESSADSTVTSTPTTEEPAEEPADSTSTTSVEPPPSDLAPGWTSFTVTDGLPGDDIWAIDVNADGTVWAMVALSRTSDGEPDEVGFARFDAGTWTSFPTPEPLYGAMAMAAGPAGTAWIVGAGEYFGFSGPVFAGTPGVWHFDGTAWMQIQGEPEIGDPWPIKAESGPDGVLWSVGVTDTATSQTGLLRHDTNAWTALSLPEHVWDCVACDSVFVAPDNTVWASYEDVIDDESVGHLARLEDDTWQTPEIVSYEVFDLPEDVAGLRFLARAGIGSDGVYFLLGVAGIEQWTPGVPLPERGDEVSYAFETYDGQDWSPIRSGTLAIGAGHTLEAGDVTELVAGGPTSFFAAHHGDTIYIAGLGGVHLLDGTGLAATYTMSDGLVSDTTQHITTGPDGALWVATDAGISVLVPDS